MVIKKFPIDQTSFYLKQSAESNPGKFEYLFKCLPEDISSLCQVVHGLVIHRDNTERLYGFKALPGQYNEANMRYAWKILEIIMNKDSSPLKNGRLPKKRFFGSCRDFALLLCSILRYKKIPARLRCGFAGYFQPELYWDHWVYEYWNKKEKRWILVDSEIGEEERKIFKIRVNNLDVPRDKFIIAGKAWEICKSGKVSQKKFGVFNIGIWGMWFIRANLFRDLAALNKIELLPWDYTYYFHRFFKKVGDLPNKEMKTIDDVAETTMSDDDYSLDRILSLYSVYPKLKIGCKILSYSSEIPKVVKLGSGRT
jgi:hypothetical protein